MDEKSGSTYIHMMIFFCTFSIGLAIILTFQVIQGPLPAIDRWASNLRSSLFNY